MAYAAIKPNQSNDAGEKGMTPWIASILSLKQATLACNPKMIEDPSAFIPFTVMQPYYLSNPVPPYAKITGMLVAAGALQKRGKAGEKIDLEALNNAFTDLARTGLSARRIGHVKMAEIRELVVVVCYTLTCSIYWGCAAAIAIRYAIGIDPGTAVVAVGLPVAIAVSVCIYPKLRRIKTARQASPVMRYACG